MTARLDQMFAAKDLRDHPLIAMHVVMGTRLCFLYSRSGRDPLPDLAVRMRSMRAAQAQQTVMGGIARHWPETFTIRRPCCMTLSPDEALIADLAVAAMSGDSDTAHAVMRDMLPGLSRERLFRDTVELVDAIRSAQTQSVGS